MSWGVCVDVCGSCVPSMKPGRSGRSWPAVCPARAPPSSPNHKKGASAGPPWLWEPGKEERNCSSVCRSLPADGPLSLPRSEAWVEKPSFGKPLEEHLMISGREIAFPIEACVTMLLECGMQEEVGPGAAEASPPSRCPAPGCRARGVSSSPQPPPA